MSNNYQDQEQAIREEIAQIDDDLAELFIQKEDPEFNKDARENTVRDDILERINKLQARRSALEARLGQCIRIPGTWNIDDLFMLTYKRIVSYGKDVEVPENPVKCQLVMNYDITNLDGQTDINKIPLMPVATNSPLGKALLNKAHTSIRYKTPVGYCEVEVERCYV